MKRPITAEDIEKDPTLVEKGFNVGDDYDFPEDDLNSEKSTSNETNTEGEGGEGDGEGEGNGGNHPKKGGGN